MTGWSARLVSLALVVGGALYFAARSDLVPAAAGDAALVGIALAVVLHLMLTVDPAWLLSAGIASTMFAGHWHLLGLGSAVGPHRVLIGAAVLAIVLRAPPARDRPPLRLEGMHLAMAAAAGFALVSAIAAGTLDEQYSQSILVDQFGVLPFVLFAVAPLAFPTDRHRMILLGTIVAIGAYLSLTALLEKLKLHELVVPGYIGDPTIGLHFGRARGPFLEAAAMGLALFTCVVAAAVAFVLWRAAWARAVAAGVVVLGGVGVLLTVTRGPWVAAIAGAVVALATSSGLRRYLVPVVAGGVAAVLVAFALIPGLAGDAEQRQNDRTPVYDRQNTNAAGLRMVADRPFFGFGFNRANAHLEPYFSQQENIPLTGAAAGLHNSYLYYAAGLGLVGFGLWVLALALAFGRAFALRAPPRLRPWQVGLKAAVVAWLVVAAFSPAHYPFTTYLVWAWAGTVCAAAPVAAAAPRLASRGVYGPRGATT